MGNGILRTRDCDGNIYWGQYVAAGNIAQLKRFLFSPSIPSYMNATIYLTYQT